MDIKYSVILSMYNVMFVVVLVCQIWRGPQ